MSIFSIGSWELIAVWSAFMLAGVFMLSAFVVIVWGICRAMVSQATILKRSKKR